MSNIKYCYIYSINVSNINSVATVTWEDFLAPMPRFRSMKEKNQLPMIKIVGIVVSMKLYSNINSNNTLVIRVKTFLNRIEYVMLDCNGGRVWFQKITQGHRALDCLLQNYVQKNFRDMFTLQSTNFWLVAHVEIKLVSSLKSNNSSYWITDSLVEGVDTMSHYRKLFAGKMSSIWLLEGRQILEQENSLYESTILANSQWVC